MNYMASSLAGGKITPFEEYLKKVQQPQTITDEEEADILKKAEKAKASHLRLLRRQ